MMATRMTRIKTDFSACGGKGRAEGESKSILIRGICVAIMPLLGERGEASKCFKIHGKIAQYNAKNHSCLCPLLVV